MNDTPKIVAFTALAISIFGLLFVIFHPYQNPYQISPLGDATTGFPIINPTSSYVVAANATSTQILAAESHRNFFDICNLDTTNALHLNVNAAASTSTGIYVAPKTCYQGGPDNEFPQAINAWPDAAAINVSTLSN